MNAVSVYMTWCLGRWGTVGWSDTLVVNAGSSGTGSNSPATQTCTPPSAAPAVCFVIDLRGQITERERDNEKRVSGIQDGCTPVFGFAHVPACLMSSWLSIPGPMCWKYSLWEPSRTFLLLQVREMIQMHQHQQLLFFFLLLLLIWIGWYWKQDIFNRVDRHALAFSDLHSQTPALPQVTSLEVFFFVFFILFYLLSIFLIESLNILHK